MKKLRLLIFALFSIVLTACGDNIDGTYEGTFNNVPTTVTIAGEKFEMNALSLTINGKRDVSSNTVSIDVPGVSDKLKFTIVKTQEGIRLETSGQSPAEFRRK